MKISKMKTIVSVCFLAALLSASASAGFVEKRETDKKIRELYDLAIKSYYKGDFERARLYWQQIVKLDKTQEGAAQEAKELAHILDRGDVEKDRKSVV